MSWRLVIAVVLLSLPGHFSLSKHERHNEARANRVRHSAAGGGEFVPELNIDEIIKGQQNYPDQGLAKAAQEPDETPVKTAGEESLSSNSKTAEENVTTKSPSEHPTPQGLQDDPKDKKKGAGTVIAMSMTDFYYVAIVAGCSVAGLIGVVVAGVCWYKLQKRVKAASEVDYPAYGITGPNKERAPSAGDRKLAQSAQMYHYQHQKQQMIAMEKANGEMKHDASDDDSEEENDEGDYTVYECPGLAPTGEMEVKNPLFNDETPVTNGHDNDDSGPDHNKGE